MPSYLPEENWLLNINGVGCNIFVGDDPARTDIVSEKATADAGRSAVVAFRCKYYQRWALVAGLVGTVGYQGGTITRTPPFSFPTWADDVDDGVLPNTLFGTSITSIGGVKWSTDADGSITGLPGWGCYSYAIVTCEFTAPPYLIQPATTGFAFNDLVQQTYCVSKLRVSGEVYSPPSGSYVWVEGSRVGKQIQDAHVGITRPRYELSVTRVRMPIVPTKALDEAIGTINATTIQIGNNTVSPDAALFMGYNVEPRTDPWSGGIVFDVELLWLVNGFIETRNADGSWNWFVDPVGDWSGIVANNLETGLPPFPESEHNDLFSNTIS